MLEGLNDGRHGIEAHERSQIETQDLLPSHLAQGIDDRRSVHPQGDEEGKQDLQVAVLSRHRGDDDAETQGETRQHYHQ